MRKLFPMFIIMLLLFVGCSSTNQVEESELEEYEVENATDENAQDDFVFRLVSEQEEYKEGENVELYGEIVYTGDDEKVTINHSSSAILFPMVEEVRDYDISFGVDDIGLSTNLEQGEPYREDYEKSVGYVEDDPNNYKQFMKDFQDRDDFPPGYYIVNGETDFSLNDGQIINIEATIDFKVVH